MTDAHQVRHRLLTQHTLVTGAAILLSIAIAMTSPRPCSAVCEVCDFDRDGAVGIADYYLLVAEAQAGTNDPRFNVADTFLGERIRVDHTDLTFFLLDQLHAWPGDSNWDGIFDPLDFIQVQQAGTFEQPEAATWATGDWNGDGVYDVSDLVYAFNLGGFSQPAKRDTPFPGLPDDRQPPTIPPTALELADAILNPAAITFAYSPVTGHLSIHHENSTLVSSLVITSLANHLTSWSQPFSRACVPPEKPDLANGRCEDSGSAFDIKGLPNQRFLFVPFGVSDVDLGPVLETELSVETLLQDLRVNGSVLPGGGLNGQGQTPKLWYVDGDFNRDGMLDSADVNQLSEVIRTNDGRDLSYDLNDDWQVNRDDLTTWVHQFRRTTAGDANLDGQFDSADLVLTLQAGRYEVEISAHWEDGDWNGDDRFNTLDLVEAFQAGSYRTFPAKLMYSVPEPNGFYWLILVAIMPRRRG